MKTTRKWTALALMGLAAVLGLQAQQQGGGSGEKPAPIVRGAGGDIPDSQAFIDYASPRGDYSLKAPEGWGRVGGESDITFADKFNGLKVELRDFAGTLTIDGATSSIVPEIVKAGRAVTVKSIASLGRKGGQAIVVTYESNSDPNPVTNRQIRLEDKAYLFLEKGKLAIVTVWAPWGADNVDQWNLISDSFRWHR